MENPVAMTGNVQPERILKELAGLWGSMSKGDSQGVNSGVLRACAMTLVVAAESEEDALAAGETLGVLMHDHPSRAIVLKPSSKDGELDARVFAQCWMPFGKRQQICCEQVEITASMDRIAEVQGTILGIMVPDLPVVLWIRGGCWVQSSGFANLFPLAHKVIIDSSRCGEPAFPLVRRLQGQVKVLADLAWTRLTSFREVIAHTFEDHHVLGQLKKVRKILVEYTSHPVTAAYLAGWLQTACPDAAVETRAKQGLYDTVLLSNGEVDIRVEFGPAVTFSINGYEHRSIIPPPTEVEIMREELSILRRDRVFQAALANAEKL